MVAEKLKRQSLDGVQHNYAQLLQLLEVHFPSCVVEQAIEDGVESGTSASGSAGAASDSLGGAASLESAWAGAVTKAIDWQALGQLIGTKLSADSGGDGSLHPFAGSGREGFGFSWVGKSAALREAMRPLQWAGSALHPVVSESVNWDETGNLYIEGDNLTALKLLQSSYLGQVKMIYIDPPYNTGNDKSFVYDDNFAQSSSEYARDAGQVDAATGARLVSNPDSAPRYHSLWCSMMYARLLVARSLLRSDGVIFISIDDHEQSHLKDICDEVFGEQNFVAQLIWLVW